jgi:hypothetical protein
MPCTEFYEWLVLEQIEPFGERGHYFRSAQLLTLLANINRKQGSAPFELSDFMPKFDDDDSPRQTHDAIKAAMMALKAQQDAHLKAKERAERKKRERQERRGANTGTRPTRKKTPRD